MVGAGDGGAAARVESPAVRRAKLPATLAPARSSRPHLVAVPAAYRQHHDGHVIAGADALKVVEDKLAFVAAESERWRALTTSTDF